MCDLLSYLSKFEYSVESNCIETILSDAKTVNDYITYLQENLTNIHIYNET